MPTAFLPTPFLTMATRRVTRSALRRGQAESTTPSTLSSVPVKRRKLTTSMSASSSPPPHPSSSSSVMNDGGGAAHMMPASQPASSETLSTAEDVLAAEKRMSDGLTDLSFGAPVTHVYNPLEYAWDAHAWYVRRYCRRGVGLLLVGMNPGPWGMAQTGIPFGEVPAVRDFLSVPMDISIGRPSHENASRPITGFSCPRSEVSGRRLWQEWACTKYEGNADRFFEDYFVYNYCPLMWMESSGRNRTPVQLPVKERRRVEDICDVGLREMVEVMRPRGVVGIGGYATTRCRKALKDLMEKGLVVQTVLHPSPASPAANKGWVQKASAQLEEIERMVEASPVRWG